MKKTILITTLLLMGKTHSAPLDDFVIMVKTDNRGASADDQYDLPVVNSPNLYNYNVDCNDDGIDEATDVNGNFTCDYSTLGGAGIYTIRIKDNTGTRAGFPKVITRAAAGGDDAQKLLSVEQWGSSLWIDMRKAFDQAINLSFNATDAPDLSLVNDMSFMFRNAKAQNLDVSIWDTSLVENMSHMFINCRATSIHLSQLDTSSVTNMNSMFQSVRNFHPDVSNWNTSNLQTATKMFAFSGNVRPDMTAWNISEVTDLTEMFRFSQLSTINYDALLNSWSSQVVNNVIFDAGESIYCAQAEHDILSITHGWTISDGGTDNTICNGLPPSYDSNPILGTTIVFPENIENAVSDVETVSINNDNGMSGSVLYGSCQISGADRVRFNFNSTSSFQLSVGASPFDVLINCQTNIPGILSAELTCSHNGPSAIASYPLNCTVLSEVIFIGDFE